jgi:hypothetical protein
MWRIPPCGACPGVAIGIVAAIGIIARGDFRGLEQDRPDEETGIWERMR